MPLTLVSSDPRHRVTVREGDVCRIGRSAQNDAVLAHPTVGSHHCVIDYRLPIPLISDLGSPSGVWVNERSIGSHATPLHLGDRVRLGALDFEVDLGEALG